MKNIEKTKRMRKIGEIIRKLESDAQKRSVSNSNNQSLMLMPLQVQLGQSNLFLLLNSLMIVLGAKGAVQAVEPALSEKDPRNLIARGLILQAGPTELQTPIKQMKVAYEMLQTLQAKYEKNESTDTQEKSRQRFYYD